LLPIYASSGSDLDRYYHLKKKDRKLLSKWMDRQALISETNSVWNHFWIHSSTQKILDKLLQKQKEALAKMKTIKNEIEKLEKTLEVQAWTYQMGSLKKINTLIGITDHINTCPGQPEGSYQLFSSDKAFEVWNKADGDLDKKVAYYAAKDNYISGCIEKAQSNTSIDVVRPTFDLCRKIEWLPVSARGRIGKYQLKKSNGQITLSSSLYFSYEGNEKNKTEAFKRLSAAKSCMMNFYARHGIKLDITFKKESGVKDWWSCDHSINLHDNYKRANSNNWTTHKTIGKTLTPEDVCSVFLHELGHKFGLPDTYPDPDCPDRKQVMPRDDIMSGSWAGADNTKLYPLHIVNLLSPLCE
jgi:hypothetical protein